MVQIKRKARAPLARPASPPGGFVELLTAEPPSARNEPQIELLLRSGHRLRLSGAIDVETVARLAAALERC